MIQTSYDPEADAIPIWFAAPGVVAAWTDGVVPGVMLDSDGNGQVIDIEVPGVRQRMQGAEQAAVARPAAQ
jgi:uncharacterized protein YuzE